MKNKSESSAKQRIEDYEEMARFRWQQRMPGKPYPGGPLAAYETMLLLAESRVANRCLEIAASHVDHGEFWHNGRHDCEYVIAAEISREFSLKPNPDNPY